MSGGAKSEQQISPSPLTSGRVRRPCHQLAQFFERQKLFKRIDQTKETREWSKPKEAQE
jgi:hypothetical protein